MAIAGLQGIINFYISRECDLTNSLSDIMMKITSASRKTASITTQMSDAKNALKEEFGGDTDDVDYQDAKDEMDDYYNVKLADISSWEAELDVQKEEIKTELEMVKNSKESYQAIIKKNIQEDFKYGANNS